MSRAIKVSDEPIGGYKFRCTHWNATEGLEHSFVVLQVAAPALASIKTGTSDEQFIAEVSKHVDSATFAKIRGALVASLEIEMTPGVWVPLASCFDDLFAGKLMAAFKVLAFAFKVQFADFFESLRLAGRPAS